MKTKTAITPTAINCVSVGYEVAKYNINSPRMYFSINGDAPKAEDVRWGTIMLVNAAPDLLAALKECTGVERDIDPGVMDRARAAIAKAEGR